MKISALALAGFALAGFAAAQTGAMEPGQQGGVEPLYRITVVGRTVTAVNYHVLSGKTSLDLLGTALMPAAVGRATVEVKDGSTHVNVDFNKVGWAQQFGNEYLTYVLWAVTPEGHAVNLGEVQEGKDGYARLEAATPLQNFALMVTAEPYFAVSRPSDVVVMENDVKKSTVGERALVTAHVDLLQRGQYRLEVDPAEITPVEENAKAPLDLFEGENAVRIARWSGAGQYAPDVLARAEAQQKEAEADERAGAGPAAVATQARAAAETAEDARMLTVTRRQQAEMAAAKDQAAASSEAAAEAQAAAQAAAQQTADAEAQRQQAMSEAQAAQEEKQQAEAELAQAQTEKAQAEAEKEQADKEREDAIASAQQARARLLNQLNTVMKTRDTASGLIMSMSDVLFEFNQYQLKPEAQVKLAKIAGILLSYPDLKLQVNGYTDNVGTPDYNQKLSENRADAVRDYLVQQGVSPDAIQASGYGMNDPVASNDSASGRQENRRVEMVVSGGAIGVGGGGQPQ